MAITITEDRMLYNVQFFTENIHTTVTANPAAVTDWIGGIEDRQVLIVGLDVEWRPSFTAGVRYPVATLQLCVDNRCLIYQIIHSDRIPASLVNFLSGSRSRQSIFVGVGIKSDLDKLQSDYGIGGSASCLDLRGDAAVQYGMEELRETGLKRLASVVLRKEVEKPEAVTMSRWDERQLTAEQVKYACVDAYLSLKIGMALGFGNIEEIVYKTGLVVVG